ncbi:MAG: GxxExxY protein [Hymenobacteraceae bacterium]|nr:GxxExxY protein [Hymenobacteraceae bacterium]
MTDNELTYEIRGAAYDVHAALGPGLLEGVYQAAMMHELTIRELRAEAEVGIEAIYKGISLGVGYRLDIVVERRVVIELKALECLLPVHHKQLLTYLKFSGIRWGLLINFNSHSLDKDNLVRKVLGYENS